MSSEFDEVYQEAEKRWYRYTHTGVKGQMLTEKDNLEYWVWEVSKERYKNG